MSDHAILTGDLKKFVASGVKVGFGTVETADPDTVKERKESLLNEMAYVKAERGFDVFFFTIVDMVNTRPGCSLARAWISSSRCPRSDMLLVGPRETALAEVHRYLPTQLAVV